MLDLNKCQKATAKAVSKCKDTILHYVHVRKGIIEAGDGYIYVQKELDYSEKDTLLDPSNIEKCSDGFPEVGGGEGNYPSFEQFFTKDKPVFSIALDRELLKKLISALGNDSSPVKFYFYGRINL